MTKKEDMQPTVDVVKIQQTQMICVSQITTTGLDEPLIPGGSGDLPDALAPGRTIPGLEIPGIPSNILMDK